MRNSREAFPARELMAGDGESWCGGRGEERLANAGSYLWGMAGRRSLTQEEERRLLRAVRAMEPRDRALGTAQWMMGFRISEVLSWTVGTVMRNGTLVSKIGLPPRKMKGGYGKTRWVPLLPELHRALESYVGWLQRRLIVA